jgi:hypothetical protein
MPIENLLNVTKSILSVINNISAPQEMMQTQFSEYISREHRNDNYSDYEEFDIDIFDAINDYEFTAVSIDKVVKSMLKLLTAHHLIVTVTDSHAVPFNLTLHKMNVSFAESSQQATKIALMSFENENPYWYSMDKNVMHSNVLQLVSAEKIPFEFTTKMSVSASVRQQQHVCCVRHANDMPIYKMIFPAASMMLIEVNVAGNEENAVKLLHKMNERPRYKDFIEVYYSIEIFFHF